MAIITMENLKYKYPGTDHLALNGITLSIEKGEFIGIVGQNGAGKSTLARIICGLEHPDKQSKLLFDGDPVSDKQRVRNSYIVWQKRYRCRSCARMWD